ncbi:MAG: peptidoglycan-binding protein [Chromatiales bacterium]|nr:peptidoglycan-binding protein [Chromatiales bacterium]
MKFSTLSRALGAVAAATLTMTAGCVTTGTETTVTSGQNSPGIQEAQAEAYDGPKARIAVAQFKDKTGKGWWTGSIGNGMADQLTTALFNSNRYIVLERQALEHVLTEQDLGASGRIRQDTAAPIGQIEGAELLIVAAVTEFEGNAGGAGGGVGGGGGGIFGAIAGGIKRAHMAIDLRVIDAKTSRILAATSVEGKSTDFNVGGALGGYGGGGALVGALGVWENTPTEKALRQVIQKAVEFVVSKTPQNYYRYGGTRRAAPAAAAVSAPAYGPSRDEIRDLQGMLNGLGYDTGTPDGLPGRKTAQAVTAFQRDQGMTASGELDSATIAAIRKAAGK